MKNPVEATNSDAYTVKGFGMEWSRFDQSQLTDYEREKVFADYFSIFPWEKITTTSVGADFGCGSGRWAQVVVSRVGKLIALDASVEALGIAKKNLAVHSNVEFRNETVNSCSLPEASLDFAYSLGVLHHLPDLSEALKAIALKLKPGAPFLVYLYYRFDGRPLWFRMLWKISDLTRKSIAALPFVIRKWICEAIATFIYYPLARTAKILDSLKRLPANFPLSYYRDKSFYTMRTDALDRFGTRLENRFTKKEIEAHLKLAGFENIRFSDRAPYWCAVAERTNVKE